MLKAKFNLTAEDMEFLRLHPNMKIWVNNKYWRANKVNFEGNDNLRELTEVELVSIEAGLALDPAPIVDPGEGVFGDGTLDRDRSQGLNNTISGSGKHIVLGDDNYIGKETNNIKIYGDRNLVSDRSVNVSITGNDVKVRGSNVTVINTDNVTVVSDNITIIDNVLYAGGEIVRLYNTVDGGLDEIRSRGASSKENLVDGGLNKNDDIFSESKIKMIDSDKGETNEI